MLEEVGFTVFAAASGREAVRLITACGGMDILVTNISRPWPDGIVVARHARVRNPAIAILFTVWPAERERLKGVPGPFYCLPKPVFGAGLKAALGSMLLASDDENCRCPK